MLNTWYDFGEGKGGTIIDLVIAQFNTDVSGALEKLESAFCGGITAPAPRLVEPKIKESEYFITDIKPLSYLPLISYLNERKIDLQIAKKYVIELYYKKGSDSYFTIGFENDSGGYETRNSLFKRSFSPKDITTIQGNLDSKKILIFEGFIDFLSYLTYIQKQELDDHIIILNSVSLYQMAIEKIKKISPSDLLFYLDNDEAGEKAKKKIIRETGLKGHSQNSYYSEYNDLNDFLRGIRND
ncbi:MAG: DNA primase [Candidatus Electrothrix sp. GM3_4]|nr:DNA primase [Candidatus Electrothrix sp. GM3_4]